MSQAFRPDSQDTSAHSSQDLKYMLFSSHISLEPMQILERRTVPWAAWTISFYILGASHAMCITRDGRHFMELLSCIYPNDDTNLLLKHDSVTECRLVGNTDGINHEIQLGTLPTARITPLCGRMTDNNWLEHAYMNSDHDDPSWTQLRWILNSTSVYLETLHSYPHEGITVFSKTTISKQDIANLESTHRESGA